MCAAVTLCLVSGQVPQSLPRLLLQLSPAAVLPLSPRAHPCLPAGLSGQVKAGGLPLPLCCLTPWSVCSSIHCTPMIIFCLIPVATEPAASRLQPGGGSPCPHEPGVLWEPSHTRRAGRACGKRQPSVRAVFLHGRLSRISQLRTCLESGPRKPIAFLWFPLIQLWFSAVLERGSAGVWCSRRAC